MAVKYYKVEPGQTEEVQGQQLEEKPKSLGDEEAQRVDAKAQLTEGPTRNRKPPAWLEDYVV
ncbi:hypothetical protein L484_009944 [Morus notabilis]|uniref:Uncharacterized protein n=1 Tax=Morus notabilis TaxID=981085 RepID=W9SFA2_9ROSA|nr:hypothetical protein L484_009944 [Morus notabilis]